MKKRASKVWGTHGRFQRRNVERHKGENGDHRKRGENKYVRDMSF